MRTSDITNLDCRKEANRQVIQKVLLKIKPLTNSGEDIVPLLLIEKLISVMSKKYSMSIKEFRPDTHSNSSGTIWRATIMNDTDFSTLANIHGLSLYEVFAKTAIYMYSVREKVGERR